MNHFDSNLGRSPQFEALKRIAQMLAGTDVTVLIKGETGTGKEMMATAIQKESNRANKSFVTLNCATLPEGLVESELFGHKKGSFTGAVSNKQGLFQAANGGTLFLDEINSLPISIQTKLLRVLESGECLAIGDTKPYHVDVRIIAATNTDLNEQINKGEFRQDLYFRLNVVPIELPALRDRTEDIDMLCTHFMQKFADEYAVKAPNFSRKSLKNMKDYEWPGNIRELRNLCERLCILLSGKVIEPENLPPEFSSFKSSTKPESQFILPELGIKLEHLEMDMIYQALERTNGNRSKSARLLGISRDTLIYRIQKHGIAPQ